MRIDSAALSHEGRVRTNNEDAYCERPREGLWAVADGMGGHENGEWASAAIADALSMVVIPQPFEEACEAIADAIHGANRRIWRQAEQRGTQMGSTVVALFIRDRRFAVLWVGDSRAYLVRGGMIHQLSRDHTQVQEMLDRGLLSEADAQDHPMSHVLARAVGVRDDVEVDVIQDEVEPGDIFLLCSDGLTGQVEDFEIGEILNLNEPDPATRKLVDLTLDRGAPDNVTIITVAVHEPTLLSFVEPAVTVNP
ncbi:serine/threonine-protein phosphatase [Sphingomonas gilva]|uniref:Serine/threonine-protein phosphatase n=2 Tax=Sphingomonas gilva TaxID=2305907 RepID=A0A396S151_9SPHN|nr:serine/threonine-protein phosphatase [Sphingomonas gilva]